jgi:hypothetical protein
MLGLADKEHFTNGNAAAGANLRPTPSNAPWKDFRSEGATPFGSVASDRLAVAIADHRGSSVQAPGGTVAARILRPVSAMITSVTLKKSCALHNATRRSSLARNAAPSGHKRRNARPAGLNRPALTGHMLLLFRRVVAEGWATSHSPKSVGPLEIRVPAGVAGDVEIKTFDRNCRRGRCWRPVPSFTGDWHDPEGMASRWI